MTGLPHDRPSAVSFDVVEKSLRAFHFSDKGCSRMSRENVATVKNHQFISPDDPTLVIHYSQTIAVTIESDAELGILILHLSNQVLEKLRDGWVWMVIGEAAVNFAKKRDYVATQLPIYGDRCQRCRSVATIHHHSWSP